MEFWIFQSLVRILHLYLRSKLGGEVHELTHEEKIVFMKNDIGMTKTLFGDK